MKHKALIIATFFSASLTINAAAQTRGTASTAKSQKATEQPISKAEQKMDAADSTVAASERIFDRAKTAWTKVFGAKGQPEEATVTIPGIEYDDPNLESLLSVVKDRKEVKKATLEYTNGTAIIKIVLKPKAEADFWIELPKEIREVFKMRSKQENSILVEYKPAGDNKAQMARN